VAKDLRPWLASYPEGVARSIEPERYASLADFCLRSCAEHGDRIAFESLGAKLRFAELDRASRHFAAYLSEGLELEQGDRVAVMLPNLLQSPIVLLGVLRAGLVAVNVNPLYTARELQHQLIDSGAKCIVVLENFAATVAEVRERTALESVVVTSAGDSAGGLRGAVTDLIVRHIRREVPRWQIDGALDYSRVIDVGAELDYQDPVLAPDDIAFLQYTGGTTGVAKGAMLTHRNVTSNVLQLIAWVRPFIDAAKDVTLTPLPLYHIFALTVNLFAFIELGARNLLITNPRDIDGFVRELGRGPFAFLTGVNTLFNALIHNEKFAKLDFSGLRITLAGGMAVQKDVADNWQRVTGDCILQGYGLTEASPVVTASPLDQTEFTGSIGLPLPDTDVAILDEAGRRLGVGDVGEICVKGPQVMKGYWQRPDETAAVFTDDDWLRTGDLGRMDAAGFFYIEDRKKDIIIVSGFNVSPNEVEDVVALHPGVLEAAAVGVPDPRSGEAVKVFVVRKDPALTEHTLLEFCRERLTGYKTPDVVEFIDELPKSNVGKVLRRELKEREAPGGQPTMPDQTR
jgi:long-chain acyl-CoA synthetase